MMKDTLHIGLIGLGCRGQALLKDCILPRREICLDAICDVYPDRCEAAVRVAREGGRPAPRAYTDYRELLRAGGLDLVMITAAWEAHVDIACAAMRAGIYTAMEVGGAYSVADCWRLVDTFEETGVPCMMMENCCYGRNELLVLNMVRQGLFGEIVHCQGGYRHDLREEIAFGRENRHYRFYNYLHRNCENYPTHELGPIANVLNINRGNRMVSLVSMASKSAGLHDYLLREKGPDYDASSLQFAQGDVVTTLIRCAHGETIALTLDTTLPRAYSRAFHVQGTRGMYMDDNRSVFLDGKDNAYDFKWQQRWNSVEEYRSQYEHPLWRAFLQEGVQGGHNGMDWLTTGALFSAVREGRPAPIDVYDAAAWRSITALSEASIAAGSAPVAIPDFTRGKWMHRHPWEA